MVETKLNGPVQFTESGYYVFEDGEAVHESEVIPATRRIYDRHLRELDTEEQRRRVTVSFRLEDPIKGFDVKPFDITTRKDWNEFSHEYGMAEQQCQTYANKYRVRCQAIAECKLFEEPLEIVRDRKLASGRTPEKELVQLRALLGRIALSLGVGTTRLPIHKLIEDAPAKEVYHHVDTFARVEELGWTALAIAILKELDTRAAAKEAEEDE